MDQLGSDLLTRRLLSLAEHDLAERPRIALRTPSDHDGRGSGGREHALRTGTRRDVPGCDHRDVDELDELRSQRVIGGAGVHLPGGTGMQRQCRGSRRDQLWADCQTRTRSVLQAATHLHRHGDVDRLRHRGHDGGCPVGILEQGRAGPGLRHLPDWASEVYVHDVRARRDDHPRGLRHHAGIGSEDLDRQRVLVPADAQIAQSPLVSMLQPGAADHLRAHQPRPVASSLTAKGLHRDTGHGCQNEAGRDLDLTDPP